MHSSRFHTYTYNKYCIDLVAEEDCSVTMVSGKVSHNQRRNRTRLRFSSDGDQKVTYQCKLDDGKFNDCEFVTYYNYYCI